jgi:hypothetical protein
MTGDQRRLVWAAALWAVFALILWNVIFDYGVRTAASRYLVERTAFLKGRGPAIELGPAMRAGVVQSLRPAFELAVPCALVAVALAAMAIRRRRRRQ